MVVRYASTAIASIMRARAICKSAARPVLKNSSSALRHAALECSFGKVRPLASGIRSVGLLNIQYHAARVSGEAVL